MLHMNFKSLHTLLAGLLFLSVSATAQEPEEEWEGVLEQHAMETERETEDDELFQTLKAWTHHPLNLNTATLQDMQTFFFLNDLQIRSFLKYRKLLGRLISIYEL